MKYKDLNLRQVMETTGLDFAHYTYKRGQCSCCYGPKDLARSHWREKVIPEGNDYTYILYKNACNGSGTVKANDDINDIDFLSWNMPAEMLEPVCCELSKQYGEEATVFQPKDTWYCIQIILNSYSRLPSADEYPTCWRNGVRSECKSLE